MRLTNIASRLSYFAVLVSLSIAKRCNVFLSPAERRWLAFRLMQDRLQPRTQDFAELMASGVLAWKNCIYDMKTNGESHLLGRLASFNPQVVIDVGANVGDWAVAALEAFPLAVCHAFEISNETAALLLTNATAFEKRLIVNATGLSDHEGELHVYSVPGVSERTSTLRSALTIGLPEQLSDNISEMIGRITTGDAYMSAHDISKIDFLKIDVEGGEMSVFNGFSDAFNRQRIDVVQFEYGTVNLMTRVMLADLYDFLERRNFAVGKLYPEGVAFKPYSIRDEDFLGPNYVACRLERTDIIEAIRCPPLAA